MSESKVTLTAATIISIFDTAASTFHNEFFNWAFSKERDNKYPCYSVSDSDERDNGVLYKEWLLAKWSKDFNITPEELSKLDSYLSDILGSEDSDEE